MNYKENKRAKLDLIKLIGLAIVYAVIFCIWIGR